MNLMESAQRQINNQTQKKQNNLGEKNTTPKESRLKKVKVETEKVRKLSEYIPTDHITELNELIYAGIKLVSDKIRSPQRNPNRNTKPE